MCLMAQVQQAVEATPSSLTSTPQFLGCIAFRSAHLSYVTLDEIFYQQCCYIHPPKACSITPRDVVVCMCVPYRIMIPGKSNTRELKTGRELSGGAKLAQSVQSPEFAPETRYRYVQHCWACGILRMISE